MRRLLAFLLFVAPAAIADTLLVLNKADATLSFVDTSTLRTLVTIPTGEGPHEIAVTRDGRTALVANYGTGPNPGTTVSVIDVKRRRERKRMSLPGLSRPHGMFASGSKVYFTCEGSKAVARYDAAADTIDWIAGTGQDVTHMIVLTPDGKKAYTANIGSNSVTVLDLAEWPKKMTLKQIAVGKGPEGIDISPDGRELWVAQRGDGGIAIIDVSTDAVAQTITGGKIPIRVKFTPDGKRVLVTDPPNRELLVFDAVKRDLLKRVAVEAEPVGVLIAPDGKRAYVACSGAARVMIIDLDSLVVTASIPTGNQPDGMAYVR